VNRHGAHSPRSAPIPHHLRPCPSSNKVSSHNKGLSFTRRSARQARKGARKSNDAAGSLMVRGFVEVLNLLRRKTGCLCDVS
jgi:hypothetical protein